MVDRTDRPAGLQSVLLHDLIERMPFGVSILRGRAGGDQRDLRFVVANRQASLESGMDLNTVRGKTVAEAFPAGADGPIAAAWQRALDTDGLQHIPAIPYGDDRHPAGWFDAHSVPFGDGYVASVYRNVTRERQAMEALEQSNVQLEQFARVVAHDLRGPLATLRAAVGELSAAPADEDPADRRDLLELISAASVGMATMVGGVLELARLGADRLRTEATDLNELVADVVSMLRSELEAVGGDVQVAGLPRVQVDPTQMGRVLQNLVSNAITYRGDGPPRVRVDAASLSGDRWIISVRDNGCGIPAAQVQTAQQPLRRL